MSQYCTPTDVTTYGIPSTAIPATITTPMIVSACVAASAEADNYLRGRYPLPITGSVGGGSGVFDIGIVKHTALIATKTLLTQRGFALHHGADETIDRNYMLALEYFKGIQRQNAHPDVTYGAPPSPNYTLPNISSRPPRGI